MGELVLQSSLNKGSELFHEVDGQVVLRLSTPTLPEDFSRLSLAERLDLLDQGIVTKTVDLPIRSEYRGEVVNNRTHVDGVVTHCQDTASPELRALIEGYFISGVVGPSVTVAPTLVSSYVGVSRTLNVTHRDIRGEIGLSFGTCRKSGGKLIIENPTKRGIEQTVRDNRKRQGLVMGTTYYNPISSRSITNYNSGPTGAHTHDEVRRRVDQTALAHARCQGMPGVALPTVLATFESSLFAKGTNGRREPMCGVAYQRPKILMPHQIWEAALIAGNPQFWSFSLYKTYANIADLYRKAGLVHLQLHGSNRGLTVDKEVRAYFGDWTTTLEVDSVPERSYNVVLPLLEETLFSVFEQRSSGANSQFVRSQETGISLRMDGKQLLMLQMLLVPLRNDISMVFTNEALPLLEWPEQERQERIARLEDQIFLHTLYAIDRGIRNGDPDNITSEGYSRRAVLYGDYENRKFEFYRKLDKFAPGFVQAVHRQLESGETQQQYIALAFTRIMAAHLMCEHFGAELISPVDAIKAMKIFKGDGALFGNRKERRTEAASKGKKPQGKKKYR